MNLINKLSVLAIALGGLVVLPLNASAQSTCSNDDDLRACAHGAVVECRSVWGCEDDSSEALTAADIIADAANCCTKSTKKARACLNRYAQRLNQATGRAPSFVKRFLRTARAEVRVLRINGCDTGTLGDL